MQTYSVIKSIIIPLAVLIVIGIICYANTMDDEFHFDDQSGIVENEAVHTLSDIGEMWSKNRSRFLGVLSFALNYRFGKLNVFGYHLVNLLIHIITAFLAYVLLSLLLASPRINIRKQENPRLLPLFAAALFIAHPVQTQAVTYIVQRFACLVALFYILSLILYLQYALIRDNISTMSKSKAKWFYIFSLLSGICAMSVKENSATLPLAIIMMEYFFFCDSLKEFKQKVPKLIPYVLMMAIVPANYITGTAAAPDVAGGLIPGNYREISHGHYLLTQFNVIRTYIRLLIIPVFQNLDYDYPVSRTLFGLPTLLSLLFLASLSAVGVWMFKKDRLVSFGIFFFFLALSIESSIIPIWDVVFEHRLYLPFVGFAIIAGRVLFTVLPNLKQFEKDGLPSPSFYVILAAIIALLGFLTVRRNTIWQNEITLWQDVIRKSPNKARGHINLGLAYQNRGMLKEAYNAYLLALKFKPRDTDAHYNLGNLYRDIGKPDLAINEYARVIQQEPDYIKAHLNLGVVYNQQGMPDKAVEAYQKVTALNPGYGLAYYNLGNIFIRQNQFDRAISYYKKAAERMPDHPGTRNNMGVALERAGQIEAARQAYQDALRVHPGYTDALKNLDKLNRKMQAR